MKICFFGNANSILIRSWVSAVARRGHEVHLFSCEGAPHINGVTLHACTVPRIPLAQTFFRVFPTLPCLSRVTKLVRTIKPDIVHVIGVSVSGWLGIVAGYHPLILSVMGSDIFVAPKKSKIARWKAMQAVKSADLITGTTDFMVSYVIERFNAPAIKTRRSSWGIDAENFRPSSPDAVRALRQRLGIPGDAPVIVSSRNMKPHYRIDSIMRSVPLVVRKYPSVRYVFFRGYGLVSYENELKELAKRLDVLRDIIFVSDVISSQEMPVYCTMAAACVSVPLTDQFGYSIMEAMACGAVPIVGRLAGYEQYLRDQKNALFVAGDDPSDIAEKVVYVLRNPALRESFFRSNRRIIEDNEDLEKNTGKLVALYTEMIDTYGKQSQ